MNLAIDERVLLGKLQVKVCQLIGEAKVKLLTAPYYKKHNLAIARPGVACVDQI